MKKTLLYLIILLGCTPCCHAQLGKLYMGDKFLLSSISSKIIQDDYGRIWIGTRNGINVYDGYRFRNLQKENKNNLGLDNNYINEIYQDSHGNIYIGNNDGVQVFKGDRFYDVHLLDKYKKEVGGYVACIYQRRDGEVLISIPGRGIFQLRNDTIAQAWDVKHQDFNTVHRIFEDDRGRLWLLTQDKVFVKEKTGRWNTCKIQDDSTGPFQDICQGQDKRIYIASVNGGLYRLQPNNNTFVLECIPASRHIPLSTIMPSKNGNIILGSDGMGAFRYDPRTQQLQRVNLYCKEFDINRTKIVSILEDNDGNLWFSLFQKGIFMQPSQEFGFQYLGYKSHTFNVIGEACVMATRFGNDGTLWVSTDKGGLYALTDKGELKRHYMPGNGTNGTPYTILGISEDENDRLWVATFLQGAGWIDKTTGDYHRLSCTYNNASNVFDVIADKFHHLWIGTMGDGLKRVDLLTGKVTEYKEGARQNAIGNNYVNQLSLSPDGNRLYVGSCGGVYCLDIRTGKWMSFSGKDVLLPNISINDMVENQQQLWIATLNGLCRYDLRKKSFKWYTTEEGLADNNISAIRIDGENRVWVSTYCGLSCLSPGTGDVQNYYANDGLQGNEFSEGVSCMAPNGYLAFGGMGGVTLFHPKDIRHHSKKLSIQLTDFTVGGDIVTAGMKSGSYTITDTTTIASQSFDLGHEDNSFTIAFSTLSFANPERIVYAYRVNDENWTVLQPGVNEITFSHLQAGAYHFEVKASDGNADSDTREFTVVIHPAWYFSGWAKVFYVLLIIAATAWVFNVQRRKAQDRLRLQEHIHSEELGEAKLRFFMNISHEIRTPMTLIITPLLSLIKTDKDATRQGVYEIIRRNAERILHLINQMMDLRKIDKGQMALKMQETNLISFIKDVYELFLLQAKAKNITLRYAHDTEELPAWIDRDNFDKVVMNILSNAFKFTPSGGEVIISITHDDKMAHLSVKDNGEQIPADKLEKIFERFYQSPASINNRKMGTGIGLDLTRSLVELHHGTITARNNDDGHGCEFVVTIPLGKEHLMPEELYRENARPEKDISPLVNLTESDLETEDANEMLKGNVTSSRLKLAIVEDDDEIRAYLRQELAGNFIVSEYRNGAEGLMGILKNIPDLVISDILMPEMDGNTLCLKLKTNVNTNHVPVILLTAQANDENKLEGLETGADAYIVKPFNMDILRRTIFNLLNARNILRNKYSGQEGQTSKVNAISMKSPDEKLLEKVMAVINRNLDNSDLSVDMIAAEVGISRVHLHRKMKKLTNQTPHDFIRNIRLKQAANLLATQDHNITEVMYACGFSNSASFSTTFKNFYGMSPREYMKEHRKQEEGMRTRDI